MGWKIKYVYNTGNTFEKIPGQEGWLRADDQPYNESYLWESLEDAQEALRRMGEHYLWQDSLSTTYSDDLERPEWHKDKICEGTKYSWYFNAPGNNGEEIWFYAGTYLGYFETLVSAEIVSTVKNNNPNRIDFGDY